MTTRIYVEFDNEHAASNFLADVTALYFTNHYGITDHGYLED